MICDLSERGHSSQTFSETLDLFDWKFSEIDARGNRIKKTPSFARFVQLSELYLDRNEIEELPNEFFCEIPKLVRFGCSRNSLTCLPSSLTMLSSLKELNVSDNEIVEFPKGISRLTSLTELCAKNNMIKYVESEMCSLVNLQTLSLRENKLVYIDPTVTKLASLKVFNLADNPKLPTEYSVDHPSKRSKYSHFGNYFSAPKDLSANLTSMSAYFSYYRSVITVLAINKLRKSENPLFGMIPKDVIRIICKMMWEMFISEKRAKNTAK